MKAFEKTSKPPSGGVTRRVCVCMCVCVCVRVWGPYSVFPSCVISLIPSASKFVSEAAKKKSNNLPLALVSWTYITEDEIWYGRVVPRGSFLRLPLFPRHQMGPPVACPWPSLIRLLFLAAWIRSNYGKVQYSKHLLTSGAPDWTNQCSSTVLDWKNNNMNMT